MPEDPQQPNEQPLTPPAEPSWQPQAAMPQDGPAMPEAPTPTPSWSSADPVATPTPTPVSSTAGPSSPAPMAAGPSWSSTNNMPNDPAPTVVTSQVPTPAKKSRRLSKPLLLATTIAVALIVVGGGLVFGLYLPNTPDGVYKSGLENTGKMFDALLTYSRQQNQVDYKGAKFDGSVKVKSGVGSFDIGFDGAVDNTANVLAHMDTDIMGVKGSAELRSVRVSGNSSPDVYFQIHGIKKFLASAGLSSLDSLDGKWLVVDHTLLDTYKAQLGSSSTKDTTGPTYAQFDDAMTKAQAVNRQYLFTTDSGKAVLKDQKFLGEVQDGGQTLDHYRVGYDKDHLKAYLSALGDALDSSQLNDWSKKMDDGKKLSERLNLPDLQSKLAGAKAGYTFELWINTANKMITKLSFPDVASDIKTMTISLDQTAAVYKTTMNIEGTDDSGKPQTANFTEALDTGTNKVSATFVFDGTDGSTPASADVTFNITPSRDTVRVQAPKGATSLTELLLELGLSGDLGGGASSTQSPLIFQQ